MALTEAQVVILYFLLNSPVQCVPFYVEKIDLTSKLRKSDQKREWSRQFEAKSPLTNFQTLIYQISL